MHIARTAMESRATCRANGRRRNNESLLLIKADIPEDVLGMCSAHAHPTTLISKLSPDAHDSPCTSHTVPWGSCTSHVVLWGGSCPWASHAVLRAGPCPCPSHAVPRAGPRPCPSQAVPWAGPVHAHRTHFLGAACEQVRAHSTQFLGVAREAVRSSELHGFVQGPESPNKFIVQTPFLQIHKGGTSSETMRRRVRRQRKELQQAFGSI
jgi:hypothetical protein